MHGGARLHTIRTAHGAWYGMLPQPLFYLLFCARLQAGFPAVLTILKTAEVRAAALEDFPEGAEVSAAAVLPEAGKITTLLNVVFDMHWERSRTRV